jgi:hypothetical protein
MPAACAASRHRNPDTRVADRRRPGVAQVHRLELARRSRKNMADLVMAQRDGGNRRELRGVAAVEGIGTDDEQLGKSSQAGSSRPVRPRSRRCSRRAWECRWRQDGDERVPGAVVRGPQGHRSCRHRRCCLAMLFCDASSCRGRCGALACRFPVPGYQFVQLMALGSPRNDALQRVGQIGLRIKFMELCRVHERCRWRSRRAGRRPAA